MVPRRVRAGVLGAGLLACAPEPCAEVEGLELWDTGVSGPLCVLGDVVVNNRTAAELARLERIESIAGSLLVFANPEWTELPRFASLREIGGALSISDNPALTTIDAFPALERIGGTLYVGEHPRLVSVELGDRLAEIGGLQLALNPELAAIAGLQRVESLAGDFIVQDSERLATLEFPALARVDGALGLVALPNLRSVDFSGLVRLGRLNVASTGLDGLVGFSPLEGVGSVFIHDNPRMTELDLTGWTLGSLNVRDNAGLQRLAAVLTPVPETTATVFIIHNAALTRIDCAIDGEELRWLVLTDNGALAQLAPWTGLTQVEGLRIEHNASLTELRSWLPALSRAGEVWIFGNAALPPAAVDALLAEVEHDDEPRVGDNEGQVTVLDPCPWPDDSVCDGEQNADGEPGTGLCLVDPYGCGV
ncbi:hypothetical protein [Nannocystis punicea]|uniref:Receptor L domain-containing protein n=1 Tax=Nannocystis punicea TaxID=2995304 RepID=A0ABY7H810_9BACT|nr:hypothetical protein [Nannocystis poenicansa]WAS95392.1 hypothetical protein O0S08_04465 [Nannocystis poenicansa]